MSYKVKRQELTKAIGERTPKSGELYKRAIKVLPGGEVSGVRMFDPWPFYATKGEGAYIWDVDGNRYIDCCMCYGVLLLGHQPSHLLKALRAQLEKSVHYGAPLPGEVELAEKFVQCVPCADRLILCNTGNESIHKAVAIARSYTGKDKIAKFEGCFHGSNEYSMWSIHLNPDHMGPVEHPNPVVECSGFPKAAEENLVLLPCGDEAAFDLIEAHAAELAVVMVEVILGAGGGLAFERSYLEKLREVTRRNGILLMFDEVITGFRLGLGGAQEKFGVIPDIATFGKAMGGGTAIGAIGTSWEILDKCLDLEPPLSIAGTFSGNAMTIAATNAMIDYLMENSPRIYQELEAKGDYLRNGFNDFARKKGYPASVTGVSSMFHLHMMAPPPVTPRDLIREDKEVMDEFALRLRLAGIFLPYPLHGGFVSPAHSDQDIEKILEALKTTSEKVFEGR